MAKQRKADEDMLVLRHRMVPRVTNATAPAKPSAAADSDQGSRTATTADGFFDQRVANSSKEDSSNNIRDGIQKSPKKSSNRKSNRKHKNKRESWANNVETEEDFELLPMDYSQYKPLLAEEDDVDAMEREGSGGGVDNVRVMGRIESALTIAVQVSIPFLIAGFGMVGAGLVLDTVQHWTVFREVTDVFILVPALLGLKGNLEMTLASRLSTQANMGYMDSPSQQWSLVTGNLALIQCQATAVGFLGAIVAVLMGWIPDGKFEWNHAILLIASSLVTASVASLLLSTIMVAVIILSRRFNINPDNVATPIAASLGDLTTLMLLAWISTLFYDAIGGMPWLAPVVIVVCLILAPLWALLAKSNKYTSTVLYTGWLPVISAMAISSVGGLILDATVTYFKGIAVFQPVINGVGGNLVAVQASRVSTSLHQESQLGTLPPNKSVCYNPFHVLFGSDHHSRTARVLMLMVVPGHLIFMYTISYMKAGHTSLTPIFVLVYLIAALIQVALLLYFAYIMVHWMWKRGIDPDNSAIPYLTALGDLLGTALLACAFSLLYTIGDKDTDVGD